MNKEVSFPISKLLKEKGYDVPTLSFYFKNGAKGNGGMPFNWNHYKHEYSDFSAPTIAEVCMWLYEKNGIWIVVQPNEPYVDDDWCFTIFKNLKNNNSLEGYNSPTEAYEAAIEYTLKNLNLKNNK